MKIEILRLNCDIRVLSKQRPDRLNEKENTSVQHLVYIVFSLASLHLIQPVHPGPLHCLGADLDL